MDQDKDKDKDQGWDKDDVPTVGQLSADSALPTLPRSSLRFASQYKNRREKNERGYKRT